VAGQAVWIAGQKVGSMLLAVASRTGCFGVIADTLSICFSVELSVALYAPPYAPPSPHA
jgi:hypothetical protein